MVAPVIIYKLFTSLLGREGNPSNYLCPQLNLFKTQALYLVWKVLTYVSPVGLWKVCKFIPTTVMPWKYEWCGHIEYNWDQRFHVPPRTSNCNNLNNLQFQTIYTWRELDLKKKKKGGISFHLGFPQVFKSFWGNKTAQVICQLTEYRTSFILVNR